MIVYSGGWKATETMGEYRKHRNRLYRYALQEVKEIHKTGFDFNWTMFYDSVMAQMQKEKLDVSTPIVYVGGKTEGGYSCAYYPRINRYLNTCVRKGILKYKMVRNKRWYYFA